MNAIIVFGVIHPIYNCQKKPHVQFNIFSKKVLESEWNQYRSNDSGCCFSNLTSVKTITTIHNGAKRNRNENPLDYFWKN